MGNQTSGENTGIYAQVSQNAENENNDDLMFVFHTTDGDSIERVVHDSDDDNITGISKTFKYTITLQGKVIADYQGNLNTFAVNDIMENIRPGDAVEYIGMHESHWAVYVGSDMFIHLNNGQIRKELAQDICCNGRIRIMNTVYKYSVFSCLQIIHNAKDQIGKRPIWKNSECFVMWCRTGKIEFTNNDIMVKDLDSKSPRVSAKSFTLEWSAPDTAEQNEKKFSSLSNLIEFRRNLQKVL